jgi:hypothetical protein
LAPAAFWFGCALWSWSKERRLVIALSALATALLVSLGIVGLFALYYLAAVPI